METCTVDASCDTFHKFIQEELLHNSREDCSQSLIDVVSKIVDATRQINGVVRRYGISSSSYMSEDEDDLLSGDNPIDVAADQIMTDSLAGMESIHALISEANEEPIRVSNNGSYIVAFNALDGSSNFSCHASVGTIFGVYDKERAERNVECGSNCSDPLLCSTGRQSLLASGWVLYGACTVLVLTFKGSSVNSFILDPVTGEFVLDAENIRIRKQGKLYSINEGFANYWDRGVKEYVKMKKDLRNGIPYKIRYIGSMVADIHRTLLSGGIFLYPETKFAPSGKVRLLYECMPCALVMEQAGGSASNGTIPILDVRPKSIHQRTQIFVGSPQDVEECREVITAYEREFSPGLHLQ